VREGRGKSNNHKNQVNKHNIRQKNEENNNNLKPQQKCTTQIKVFPQKWIVVKKKALLCRSPLFPFCEPLAL
jgi:hypothetical protein